MPQSSEDTVEDTKLRLLAAWPASEAIAIAEDGEDDRTAMLTSSAPTDSHSEIFNTLYVVADVAM